MEEGQQSNDIHADPGPQFFGDYEAVRSIGKGKFAVVYRAHKVGDDQNVALKRISVDMMNDKAREKCLKEVRLLQSLDHPNIIRYMDSFICNNDLIIVYEWAAAGDLKRQLRKAQERGTGFEERVIWKYFSQICSAMQHMHEKRIMHRDLKPANIFLTLDGTIKVGDLGLSRELSDNTFQAHSKVGTPLYMSPEVLKGDGYDFKSDIWSLGCLLYELAMLKSPFRSEGLNLYSLFQKISHGDYQPLPDGYSEELRNLTYSMISTKPEDRPEISYVCHIANRMRSQTASDKGSKKGRPSAGNSAGLLADTHIEIAVKPSVIEQQKSLMNTKDNIDFVEKESILPPADKATAQKVTAGNPFQRNPSNISVTAVEELKSEVSAQAKIEFADNFKDRGLPLGEVTLGEYFREQEKGHNKTDLWKAAKGISIANHESDFDETPTSRIVEAAKTLQSTSSGRHNPASTAAPEPEFSSVNAVYRRAKPSRNSVQATNITSITTNSRAGTAENISRPMSGTSRPSTVDDNPLQYGHIDVTNPKIKEALENASASFALMDLTYGKLQLLGYPMSDPGVTEDKTGRGRLLPLHFAVNTNVFENVAGCQPGYQFMAFKRFVHVIIWLCEMKISSTNASLQNIVGKIDCETASSITIARQIMQAAQAAGDMNDELSNITPSSLINGYGYNVVVILSHFVDCSLRAVKFETRSTLHSNRLDQSSDNNHDDTVEDDSIDGECSGESENDEGHDITNSQMSISIGPSRFQIPDFIGNKIDPVLWKQETERVSGLLKKNERSFSSNRIASWRHHLDVIAQYCAIHLTHFKNHIERKHEVFDPMEKPLGRQNDASAASLLNRLCSPLMESIICFKNLIASENEKISQNERYLNNHPQTVSYSGEFALCRNEHRMLEENGIRSMYLVAELRGQLNDLDNQLAEVHKLLTQKISGNYDSGTDTVVKIKEAILQLQLEIHHLHTAGVIANEELLARRKSRSDFINRSRKYHDRIL